MSRTRFPVLVAALVAITAVILRLAWVGDDAYITLRTVEHFAEGHGLRWNVAERVQTYTHPLWMLLLAGGRAVSGEVYYTTLVISVTLSLMAVALLLRRTGTAMAAVFVAVLLLGTRAFGEYATSGLENPLSYALLAAFVGVATGTGSPGRRGDLAVLIASLLVTNRMDLALLVAPAVVATLYPVPWSRRVRSVLVMSLPFTAWVAFAAFYYGSPFPITAHAKLGTGVPGGEMLRTGLLYVGHAAITDPLLVATIVAGAVVGIVDGRARSRMLVVGIVLYVGYVVRIGGDFMEGRLLTPPFVVAVAILAASLRGCRERTCGLATLAAAAVGLATGLPVWCRTPAADVRLPPPVGALPPTHDERCHYYEAQGLLSPTRSVPVRGSLERLIWSAGRERDWIVVHGSTGRFGYELSAKAHVVDQILCDPLLMRLPVYEVLGWLPGHGGRRLPEGYLETLATGENRLHHAGLHRYYDVLRSVLRDPLLEPARLAALARLWSGAVDGDLQAFLDTDYRRPPRLVVAAQALAPALAAGSFWFDEPRLRLIYAGGLEIVFDSPVTARSLHLQLLGISVFHVAWRRDGVTVGRSDVHLPGGFLELQRLTDCTVTVPDATRAFDSIWLDGDHLQATVAAVGSLRVPD